MVTVIFGQTRVYHFYPFAKDRSEKINELQAITFDDESASDDEKCLAPPKRAKRPEIFAKIFDLEIFGASKNQKLQIV